MMQATDDIAEMTQRPERTLPEPLRVLERLRGITGGVGLRTARVYFAILILRCGRRASTIHVDCSLKRPSSI